MAGPIQARSAPRAGAPPRAGALARSSELASAAGTTPATMPRQPACTAATRSPIASSTGTQSAVITDSARPRCARHQRVPLAVRRRPPSTSTTRAECTWRSAATGGAAGSTAASVASRVALLAAADEAHLDAAGGRSTAGSRRPAVASPEQPRMGCPLTAR